MEINFEPFSYPDQLAKQRSLFVECFPEVKDTSIASIDHYKWKFKNFPTNKRFSSYEYVAKLGDDLVGYYAAIPYGYKVNGRDVSVAMVCDVMTGVKARGRGVFTKMGVYATSKFKEEGLAFSTGYPIRPAVIPGHKKAGWDFPFQIPMFGKFIRLDSFLKSRRKGILLPFANVLLWAYNFLSSLTRKNSKEYVVETYDNSHLQDIKGLELFLRKWESENPIALNKSISFLRWRLGAPKKKYEIVICRNKNTAEIVGYTVFRPVEKEGVPCVGILDFCFLSTFEDLSGMLLSQIENRAKEIRAELLLIMMMKKQATRIKLRSAGYFKTPFPFSFIIKQFDNSLDADFLKNETNWSLMWIDSDDL